MGYHRGYFARLARCVFDSNLRHSLLTEKSFWEKFVKAALHRPPLCVAWKVQDAFNKGLPDADYCLQGFTGRLELKYIHRWPERDNTPLDIKVSIEQRRLLLEWWNAGGAAYVLVGVEKSWFLLPPTVPFKLTRLEVENFALTSGRIEPSPAAMLKLFSFLRKGRPDAVEADTLVEHTLARTRLRDNGS
jgi:hypothetical protein